MKLKNSSHKDIFLSSMGGSDTVTGSCHLLTLGKNDYLIDAGLFQGRDEGFHKNQPHRLDELKKVKAIFLTHAHLDHCGFLPRLALEGYHGPIFCTAATRDLAELVMLDAASILQAEALKANKGVIKKSKHVGPLYRTQDVQRVMNLIKVVEFEKWEHHGDLEFCFYPAGHIPGASCLSLRSSKNSDLLGEERILFSGDLGRVDDLLIRPPKVEGGHTLVIMESTYGDRVHPSKGDPKSSEKVLPDIIRKVKAKKGVLLVPAFSIARSQMLLKFFKDLMERDHNLKLPVFMDSPMGLKANHLFSVHAEQLKISKDEVKELFEFFKPIKEKWDEEGREKTESTEAQILISSSGMLTGGKVLEHFKNLSTNSDNFIFFPGYLGEGTLGRKVADGDIAISAEVLQAKDFSSHADQTQLLQWLSEATEGARSLPHVYLIHGSLESRTTLKEKVEENLRLPTELVTYEGH